MAIFNIFVYILALIAPSIIVGLPLHYLIKNSYHIFNKKRLLQEMLVGVSLFSLLYLIESLTDNYLPRNIEHTILFDGVWPRYFIFWLLSFIWYQLLIVPLHGLKLKGKQKYLATFLLISYVILFFFTLYSQWWIFTIKYK